jgi:hypothetical protein
MSSNLSFDDLGFKIALPYNHDLKLLELIEKYKGYIYTLYLPPPPRIMFSGDVTQKVNWQEYEQEIFYLHNTLSKWGIGLSILYNVTTVFNQSIYQNFIKSDIYAYTKDLLEHGIDRFVISDIYLAIKLKEHFPQIKIEVSLNAFINTLKKAIHWVDSVDPDTICVAEDMNKDLKFIANLKKITNKKIKLLVNSRCQVDCPNAIAHANLLSCGYPVSHYMCGTEVAKKPWLAYRGNAVVPYNLRYYKGIVDYIKFIGRTQETFVLERDLQQYVDNCNSRAYALHHGVINESFQHYDDLGEYIIRDIKHPYLKDEPKDVFKKVSNCQKNCQICNWCFERWKKDWQITEDIDPIKGIKYPYTDLF